MSDTSTPLMGGHKLMSFAAAAKAAGIPGYHGQPHVNASTLYRWHTKGVRLEDGTVVRLEAVRIGCRRLTTLEAIVEFSRRLTKASAPAAETPRPPADRSASNRRQQQVGRELDAAGISIK